MQEFFNLGALDQGKSYAERAHASAAAAVAGNGIGHGLRCGTVRGMGVYLKRVLNGLPRSGRNMFSQACVCFLTRAL